MGEIQLNKPALTRAGIAVAGTALLVGGLTACGGDKVDGGTGKADGGTGKGAEAKAHSSVEAVKASYLKTVAAKFAKAELSIVESGGKTDGKTDGQSGTKGWYPSSHDVILKSEKPDTRSIMIGDMVYTHLGEPLTGKSWMSMNLAKDGKPGVRLNDDPAEYLAMLLGQEKVTHVGAEKTAEGIEAEHYKGSLSNADLLTADESTKVMQEADRQYLHESVKHLTTVEMDLWIGKDGYPVRAEIVSTDGKSTTKTSAKFSDFGKAAPVEAPSADQVTSLDDVTKETDRKLEQADKDLKEADKKLRDAGLGGLDLDS